MKIDKPRIMKAFKKTINTLAELTTDAVPAVVSLYDPVMAIPAGVVSTLLKIILTNIIESEQKNPKYETFISGCCELANIDLSEQEEYISSAMQISKRKDFEQACSSCLSDLESFYNRLVSLTNSYKENTPYKRTTKLVDLLFYSCIFLELSKLTSEERTEFFQTEVIKLAFSSFTKNDISNIVLVSKETRRPKDSFNFLSRINEINNLVTEINENDKIGLVSGIGGIGKTEICKYLFQKCRNQKSIDGIKYIGWITYNNNLVETLYSQVLCKKNKGSVYSGYEDSLAYLNSLGNELLLFVDNLDNTSATDSEIIKLLNLNCKLVITTRIQVIDGIKPILIEALDEHWTYELFRYFCKRKLSEEHLHRIYEITQGHPLTVELLAKTIDKMSEPISEIICLIEEGGFNLKHIDKSISFEEYNNYLIDHLKRFFSVQKLPGKYKQALYRFCLFPNYGVSSEQINMYKIGNPIDIEYLINRGWIESSDNRIAMHPIISDAILASSSNTYAHYKNMYEAIRDLLELQSSDSPEAKYADALICNYVLQRKHFNKFEYAQVLGNLGAIYNRMDEKEYAIKLHKESARIKELLNPSDKTLFTTYNNIGIAYNKKRIPEPEMTIYYLEKSKDIGLVLYMESPDEYSERYAITLSNLALAYLNHIDSDIPTATRLAIALKYQDESINIVKKYYGEEYVLLARLYNNLAHVYHAMGKEDDEYLYRTKALSISNSPERSIHLKNYAQMEFDRGHISSACSPMEEAINIWENKPDFYYNKLIEAYPTYIMMIDDPEKRQKAKIRLNELIKKYR